MFSWLFSPGSGVHRKKIKEEHLLKRGRQGKSLDLPSSRIQAQEIRAIECVFPSHSAACLIRCTCTSSSPRFTHSAETVFSGPTVSLLISSRSSCEMSASSTDTRISLTKSLPDLCAAYPGIVPAHRASNECLSSGPGGSLDQCPQPGNTHRHPRAGQPVM